ncbi:hypothetical protein PoB_003275800 [Plakobranchus ocellatus]|uniref:SMB domain-containing protein n=1 Tax=Plakobranchus ocellatus TaxID=259542 RepID=A0AAV4AI82_9GAST|nr:hypothetical protein PoB_003275800 [Plakobranchus ocellatus]
MSNGIFMGAIFCLLALYPFMLSLKQSTENDSSTAALDDLFYNISSAQRDSTRKNNTNLQSDVGVTLHNQNINLQSVQENPSNARLPFQPECENNMYSFPHSNSLCDTPDFSNNLTISKAHYSCVDRCGLAPIYGNPLECACDGICLLYGDCCWDIPNACPQAYAQAQDVKAGFVHGTLSDCTGYPSTLVITNKSPPLDASSESSTLPSSMPHPKQVSPFSGGFDFIHLKWFMVADRRSGILFKNKTVSQSLQLPVLSLSFVPKEAILKCAVGQSNAIFRYRSAARVIRNCLIADLYDIPTIFHRNCPALSAIMCPCEVGLEIQSKYYDSCLEIVNSLFQRRYHGILSHALHFGFGNSSSENKCKKVTVNYEQRPSDIAFRNEMKIRITPLFVALQSDFISHGEPYTGHDDRKVTNAKAENLSKKLTVEYVVEMANVLENRLLCNNLSNFPFHCQLDKCVPGALLVSKISPNSYSPFKDRACIYPIRAKAETSDHGALSQVPSCSCFLLAEALSSFELWDIQIENRKGVCFLQMNAFIHDKPTKQRMEPYTFSDLKLFDVSNSLTVSIVWEQLQIKLINDREKHCPYDNFQELHVCFYYFDERSSGSSEKNICKFFTVGSKSTNVCHSNYQISFSFFILIVIMS